LGSYERCTERSLRKTQAQIDVGNVSAIAREIIKTVTDASANTYQQRLWQMSDQPSNAHAAPGRPITAMQKVTGTCWCG